MRPPVSHVLFFFCFFCFLQDFFVFGFWLTMASVRWKQMHNTTLMRLFTKPYIRWEKSAQLPIKPQQPKQPREKKQKTSRKPKKTKKTKKPRVSGKGLGGHFSQIPRFFLVFLVFLVFSSFFVFFCFFFCFWFARVFFCFVWFFKRFLRSVFGSASIWIVHSRFCADCTFSTELCARCPTSCL